MGACCCRASCGTRRRWELKVVVRILDGYGRLPRWLRVLLALSWMAVLWWLTARPSGGLPLAPIHPMLTNGAHVVTFGILAALLFLAGDGDPRRRCLWAVSLTAVYGVVTELNQAFAISGRKGDTWDALSDAIGGVMFCCVLLWVRSRSRRTLWLAMAMLPLALLTTAMASGVAF